VARLERQLGRKALRVRDEHGDVAELVALRALAREHAPGALRLRGGMCGLRERAQVLGRLRRRRGGARGKEDVVARAGQRGRGDGRLVAGHVERAHGAGHAGGGDVRERHRVPVVLHRVRPGGLPLRDEDARRREAGGASEAEDGKHRTRDVIFTVRGTQR
jgi:hypothetical protein